MENINYLPQMISVYKDSFLNQPQYNYLGDNISKFVNIINPNNYKSGIYFIENFYVGKSIHLNNRIAEHVFSILKLGLSDNPVLSLTLLDILQYRKLEVKILDSDVKMEKFHILNLKNHHPLLNKQFNK